MDLRVERIYGKHDNFKNPDPLPGHFRGFERNRRPGTGADGYGDDGFWVISVREVDGTASAA